MSHRHFGFLSLAACVALASVAFATIAATVIDVSVRAWDYGGRLLSFMLGPFRIEAAARLDLISADRDSTGLQLATVQRSRTRAFHSRIDSRWAPLPMGMAPIPMAA